jgi:hypothetical protein
MTDYVPGISGHRGSENPPRWTRTTGEMNGRQTNGAAKNGGLSRPSRMLLSPEDETSSNPGLAEAHSAHLGLRFARCREMQCELDIVNEVQRLDPANPEVAWVCYQFNKERKGGNNAESSFPEIENQFTTSADVAVQNIDGQSQPDNEDKASGSAQPTANDYEFHLIEAGTPVVDRIHRVNGGWQYIELLLQMYWDVRQDGRPVFKTPQIPLVFAGRLYVELRWESVTTPLIVTLGTSGHWYLPVRRHGDETTHTNFAEPAKKAVRSLRDSYRGKNIRDMLPKLTSDLLPPPAVDELSTE